MHIITIKRSTHGKYRNPWLRTKEFCHKLNGYFLNISCAECEVDNYLAEAFSKLFNPNYKTIVIFLESYYSCDKNVQEFIEHYLNAFTFSNKIFAIAS